MFEPPPALPKAVQEFADKATNLVALRDAAVEAAGVSGPLWISYIFVLLYLAIAVGTVTHKDLFLERPVKLPFLSVDLPLTGFFALGPVLFLILHTYVLLHFVLLAGKVGAFHRELEAQIAGASEAERRTNLRRQLPSNIFIQFLAGPRDVRFGVTGWLLRLIAWISLVFGPVLLLVFFQLRFLPYHNEAITWWHRIAVLVDIGLLWWFWPQVSHPGIERATERLTNLGTGILLALLSAIPLVVWSRGVMTLLCPERERQRYGRQSSWKRPNDAANLSRAPSGEREDQHPGRACRKFCVRGLVSLDPSIRR